MAAIKKRPESPLPLSPQQAAFVAHAHAEGGDLQVLVDGLIATAADAYGQALDVLKYQNEVQARGDVEGLVLARAAADLLDDMNASLARAMSEVEAARLAHEADTREFLAGLFVTGDPDGFDPELRAHIVKVGYALRAQSAAQHGQSAALEDLAARWAA